MEITITAPYVFVFRCQICYDIVEHEVDGNYLDDGDILYCPKCGGLTRVKLYDSAKEESPSVDWHN
jgi:rRNA maturation endonuclease Nob1